MKASPRRNSVTHQTLVLGRRHRAVIQPIPVSLGTSQLCSGACGQVLDQEAYGGLAPTGQINGQGIENLLGRLQMLYSLICVVVMSVCANVEFHRAVCALKVYSLYYINNMPQ